MIMLDCGTIPLIILAASGLSSDSSLKFEKFILACQVKKLMVDWEAVPHIDQVRIIGALLLLVFERVPFIDR